MNTVILIIQGIFLLSLSVILFFFKLVDGSQYLAALCAILGVITLIFSVESKKQETASKKQKMGVRFKTTEEIDKEVDDILRDDTDLDKMRKKTKKYFKVIPVSKKNI